MFSVEKWKSSGIKLCKSLNDVTSTTVILPSVKPVAKTKTVKDAKLARLNSRTKRKKKRQAEKCKILAVKETNRSRQKARMEKLAADDVTVKIKERKPNKRNKYRTFIPREGTTSDINEEKEVVEPAAGTGDTVFKSKMEERLHAARFRLINEQLYTMSGDEAAAMFSDDKDAFQVYHNGFQKQVSHWPENPLQRIIKHLRKLPAGKVVADFGCGDAELAKQLATKHECHSFDFVALNDRVTQCNMQRVPLGDEECDVVVFCLSLMGTNLSDYLLEASRVLKPGGILKIAEVKSRIEKTKRFVKSVEKCGFSLEKQFADNQMFVLYTFIRTEVPPSRCEISLKPCLYKKR